ncbi:DUF5305 domain-containing protein [Tissierella sp.]|uniref:DUF5305 domain-containing protein n=1 Tax=Tissierella sp. TaxID=41274 RepID=UPI00286709BD|nr:DUF5305 domain-containing protein [Tissierella sp.]MDR7855065.1 DUF5305 domain-containing protein [Tissierella sp.]
MKKNINKKLKRVLIAILVILISISSFLLYREFKYPSCEEQKISLFNYDNKATANYEVFLKPNILYPSKSLGEGEIYITEFVDFINTTFGYEFSGNNVADIQGDYNIIASATGFIKGEDKSDIIIWEKDFRILPKKSFSNKGNTAKIQENISLKLDEYNEFAKAVIEASKINTSVNLNVVMTINLQAKTNNGTIEEVITPTMIIPLNTSMFQIGGNTNVVKPGAIEETNKVQLPINKNQVIFFIIILGFFLIALTYLIFFTKSVLIIKDPLQKKLKLIFKKHGDRFVALSKEPFINSNYINQVKSIDDLVRIADELCKPIMYKYSIDYRDIDRFYVINEDEVYILLIDDYIGKEEIKIES